jgi:pantetheine-phosphate adenylyltransferase
VRKAVYPGSFDPVTYGHLDLIERGSKIFDELVVSVATSDGKQHLFSMTERLEMLRTLAKSFPNVTVDTFGGLAIEHVRRHKTNIILRGIRTVSDFEYEFQMALMNRRLSEDVETFFMMPSVNYTFLSSKIVKEVFALGGSIKDLVPPLVERRLHEKFEEDRESFQ